MDKKLTEFIALLRNNGLRASPPEVADAAMAIHLTGYENRERFQTALSTTLAKSEHDVFIFNRCFESFFSFNALSREPAIESSDTSPSPQIKGLQFLFGKGQAAGSGGQGSGQPVPGVPPSALGEKLLNEENTELSLALAHAIETAKLTNIRVMTQKGLFSRRIMMAMGLEDLDRELRDLDNRELTAATQRAALLRTQQQRLRRQVREIVDRYFQLARRNDRETMIQETDFALLRDANEAQVVIRRMAKELITLHRRRDKKSARGLLDVRATLRRNQAYDGVLISPHWRRIRKDKPRVMAICDVSRSVSQHARFLLLFLYSLQEVIPRLRTFAFSSTLHEVTGLFDILPVAEAIDAVMDRYGFGSTDYGRAFADLEKQTLRDIDRRTTLIILGDARNNNGEARVDLLREFHQRAKQVIWLNPEDMNRWGSGDSEMLRYRSSCTRAHSCRNLSELERIVDRLLKTA
jgi:uncharacterized protein with von Willebrand factor type A (vWA) domain